MLHSKLPVLIGKYPLDGDDHQLGHWGGLPGRLQGEGGSYGVDVSRVPGNSDMNAIPFLLNGPNCVISGYCLMALDTMT